MRLAGIEGKGLFIILITILVISQSNAIAQEPKARSQSGTAAPKSGSSQLSKFWHSEASHKDFRLEVKGDLFHADWINIPAAAAKDGASMQIDCRRTGSKWIGSSVVNQAFGDPSAPAGKDTKKMCHLTVRFEVDSITPDKITFHSEALRGFDYSKCQILKTAWEEFDWIPKK